MRLTLGNDRAQSGFHTHQGEDDSKDADWPALPRVAERHPV